MNTNVESLAKYKAISLLGRSAVEKLKDNGLVVVNANDLEKLQADLHALNALFEVSVVSGHGLNVVAEVDRISRERKR